MIQVDCIGNGHFELTARYGDTQIATRFMEWQQRNMCTFTLHSIHHYSRAVYGSRRSADE